MNWIELNVLNHIKLRGRKATSSLSQLSLHAFGRENVLPNSVIRLSPCRGVDVYYKGVVLYGWQYQGIDFMAWHGRGPYTYHA